MNTDWVWPARALSHTRVERKYITLIWESSTTGLLSYMHSCLVLLSVFSHVSRCESSIEITAP